MSRGALIVLEGIDRTGKSTQAKMLVEALRAAGVRAEGRRFPDRTTAIGSVIDKYLQSTGDHDDHVIHLLFSANRWEARDGGRRLCGRSDPLPSHRLSPMQELERLLVEGVTLVVDRYSFSGVAFTAAKGLDMEWCRAPEVGLPEPDAVLYLELSIEDAKKRGDYGAERYEREEFQRTVKGMYERLRGPSWITVDAARPVDQGSGLFHVTALLTGSAVHEDMKRAALQVVEHARGAPIKKLWVTGQ